MVGVIRYDREWLAATVGFVDGARQRRLAQVAPAAGAAGSVSSLTYPECVDVVGDLADTASRLSLDVTAASDIFDTPQITQLRALVATLESYEMERWQGCALVDSFIVPAGLVAPWDLRGGRWADVYNRHSVQTLLPFVTADMDPDLAAMSAPTLRAVRELEDFAARHGGGMWTIQATVDAARAGWSDAVRVDGRSGNGLFAFLGFEGSAATNWYRRNVDLTLVATNGHDYVARSVPDTWIVGTDESGSLGASASGKVGSIGLGGGGSASRTSSFDRSRDGEPQAEGKVGWTHRIWVAPSTP